MNRSVLVTGGNRGIGLAVAQAFVAQGDRVAITHRGGGAPDGLFGVKCDVTDSDQVDEAFAAVSAENGPVEILVSNAGITDDGLVLRMSDESFNSVLDTNLTGAYRVAKRAAAGMLRMRRGRLIFISSVVALSGSAGQANYAASKAGLIGFSRSMSRELASRGITSNVVAPGFVETAMTDALSDERKNEILKQIPLHRYAAPAEIAAAVVFLASDTAGYITGSVLPVDGGMGMGH